MINAGGDIRNFSISVQNVHGSDITSVTAGRDIVYTPDPNYPSARTLGVMVSGSGQLLMQAGRNVDLGQSDGILTNGNLANFNLPEQGAGITVLAGTGRVSPDMQLAANKSFVGKYIDPAASAVYNNDLISYVNSNGRPQATTAAQAYDYFVNTMSQPQQAAFVRQVFFSELKSTGRNAVNTGNYQRGYDAISSLYPAAVYTGKGDVNLYASQIKTLRGGDINILIPGGGVNAGLAKTSATGPQKTAAELGIVTVKEGNVNAYVNNDFLVNQSRVFTIQGGDILMWSSYGSIDAGKGSKTASSTPPPLLVVDPKTGLFSVDATNSIVGSGIRVLLGKKNVKPGSVDLIAPTGTINAGDAGIGSAGNITLAAANISGADNINFGGTGAGVPVASVAVATVSGVGALQDANKAGDQATQNLSNGNGVDIKEFTPTFVTVEVLQLGDNDEEENQKDKKKKSI